MAVTVSLTLTLEIDILFVSSRIMGLCEHYNTFRRFNRVIEVIFFSVSDLVCVTSVIMPPPLYRWLIVEITLTFSQALIGSGRVAHLGDYNILFYLLSYPTIRTTTC